MIAPPPVCPGELLVADGRTVSAVDYAREMYASDELDSSRSPLMGPYKYRREWHQFTAQPEVVRIDGVWEPWEW